MELALFLFALALLAWRAWAPSSRWETRPYNWEEDGDA
jgi:hypothetical protein